MSPTENFHALDLAQRLDFSLRSPAPFFVTGEDALELAVLNAAASVVVTIAGRFMQLDGQVTSFQHALTPATDRTLSSVVRSLGDGWILNLTVFASSGSPLIGQTWARVRVLRGLTGATVVLGTLVSGYVTAVQGIAFPGGQVRGTLEGRGVIRSIAGTDPAAGAEVSETVPTGARWRFLAMHVVLVTDATVASRRPRLRVTDGTNDLTRLNASSSVAASGTGRFTFGGGLGFLDTGNAGGIPSGTPDPLWLLGGFTVGTITDSFQAGDNYGAPQLLVEEFLEGAA
jgi:hypothetical protein